MNMVLVAAQLKLAAAMATILAEKAENRQTWRGDISKGAAVIKTAVDDAVKAAGEHA